MPQEYKRVIKKKMDTFGQKVYNALDGQIQTSFKRNKAASIKDELPWALYSIGKAYEDRSKFQLCGLAITIELMQLSFSAVIRGGSFRDHKPMGILYQKISEEPERFLSLLSSYGREYRFTLFKRAPAKGDKIKPGSEKWLTLSRFNLGLVNYEMVDYILAVLEQEKLPGIQLSYSLNPADNLVGDPQQLIEQGAKVLEDAHRFLQYAEG